MAVDLKLPLADVRRQLLADDQPLSAQLLNRLKRDPRRGARALYAVLKRRHLRTCEERLRLDGMLNFQRVLWKSGVRTIAGVDEVGVGPLAGPVVAAAVVFGPDVHIEGVDDSKRLDPERRAELAVAIRTQALAVAIGEATVEEIDTLNVYHAALLAMRRAVEALSVTPQHLLVDARTVPGVAMPQNAFVKGDALHFSIAAASIVAKTYRDRLMEQWDGVYPEYGFARHKGYPTAQHQQAIRRFGPCPLHRRSYSFLREVQGTYSLFDTLRTEIAGAEGVADLARCERRWREARSRLTDEENRKLQRVLARRAKTAEIDT